MANGGKRKAAKRVARRAVRLDPSLVLPAAGVTFCVIAWGYLVSAAIDFGSAARNGDSAAWVYLAIACLGAAACLFAGLMMGAHVLAALGLTSGAGASRGATDGTRAPDARAGDAGGIRASNHRAGSAGGSHSSHHAAREMAPARIPGGRRAKR